MNRMPSDNYAAMESDCCRAHIGAIAYTGASHRITVTIHRCLNVSSPW